MRWGTSRNKARYRRWLRTLNQLKTWQLLILLLLGFIISATLLRLNNLGMVERRSAVLAADERGDAEALKISVVELQRYVSKHMNTDLGDGFFLSKSYERDRDAALASANQATNPNSSVYQQASVECRSRFQGGRESFRNDYVQCVVERVSTLSPQLDSSSTLGLPRADAYKISFASPLLSFDLAGLFVVLCFVIIAVILTRLAAMVLLRLLLKRHYRSV